MYILVAFKITEITVKSIEINIISGTIFIIHTIIYINDMQSIKNFININIYFYKGGHVGYIIKSLLT